MAQIEKLIPHILQWENSIFINEGETLQEAFERGRARGVKTVRNDSGGPTLCGVTLSTFQDWILKHGVPRPTKNDLARLEYVEWLAILKGEFWDPCKGDQIRNQSVANMFIDWRWHCGPQGVRSAQTAFSLVADGIVGPRTLSALNSEPAETVFNRLKAARERYYYKCVLNRPSQEVFLRGWLNRNNALTFE